MFHWFVGRALHRVSKSISPRILVLVQRLKSYMHDVSNLACHQITGTTLKNPNIEIRNTKQYRNANFQNSKQKHHDTTISRFGH